MNEHIVVEIFTRIKELNIPYRNLTIKKDLQLPSKTPLTST